MLMLLLLLLAFTVALGLTGLLRRHALANHLLDIPNARSSHHIPTPHGGGLAIAGVFLGSVPIFFFLGLFSANEMWVFLGAGIMVTVVGYIDDRHALPAWLRLGVHFLAAAWVLAGLGGPSAAPPLFNLAFGLSTVLSLFYLVWLLNLYNFMDGIDGLAAIESITVCLGGGLLYGWATPPNGHYWPLLLLAVAVAGFLYWNFPPAKIFMGDGGSGFLGLVLGIFSLQAAQFAPQFFWSWLILLGVFIVDATGTLLHRFYRGEKVYQAHRSHAYQHAARRLGGHKPVTLAVAAINILWLLPIALWVGAGLPAGVGVSLAYAPLLLAAVYFKAGAKETVQ